MREQLTYFIEIMEEKRMWTFDLIERRGSDSTPQLLTFGAALDLLADVSLRLVAHQSLVAQGKWRNRSLTPPDSPRP